MLNLIHSITIVLSSQTCLIHIFVIVYNRKCHERIECERCHRKGARKISDHNQRAFLDEVIATGWKVGSLGHAISSFLYFTGSSCLRAGY
jgi:hypothetical protein